MSGRASVLASRKLDEFREKNLVKVLTGLRRAGKSTILEMYMASLIDEGVDESHVSYLERLCDCFFRVPRSPLPVPHSNP